MAQKDMSELSKRFKKRFRREDEDQNDDEVKPMQLYQGKKDRDVSLNKSFDDEVEPHSSVYSSDGHSTDEDRMYGENDESNDEGYTTLSPDSDAEYESKQKREMEESTSPMLSKSQRKRFAASSLSKKMSKPKKNGY
jgi:hypothetical protein